MTSVVFSAIIFPVSEKMNNEKTMSKVYGARWSPHALAEVAKKKHPFVPREEPVSEEFVPLKKSEKKDEKGLDFVPKM